MPKKLTPYQIMRMEMDKHYLTQYESSHRAVKPRAYTQTPSPKQQAQKILAKQIFKQKKMPLYQQIGLQSYNDLLQKDRALLIEDIRKLQSTANSRITKLKKDDEYEYNFAIKKQDDKYLNNEGKYKADLSKMKRSELIGYFNELKSFLEMKSSTVKGNRQIRENVNKRLGIEFNKEQQKNLWKIYNKVVDKKDKLDSIVKYLGFEDSKQLQRYIASFVHADMTEDDINEIATKITNHINEVSQRQYEMEQQALREQGLGSNVFENLKRFK